MKLIFFLVKIKQIYLKKKAEIYNFYIKNKADILENAKIDHFNIKNKADILKKQLKLIRKNQPY